MIRRVTASHPRASRMGALGFAVAAMCALAACESSSTSDVAPDTAPTVPEPASTPENSGVVLPAAPQSDAGGAAAPQTAAPGTDLAARTEPAEPVVNSDPERLLGMDRGALTDLLGAPAFVRNDAPAQLWRYRNDTCLLDLFLYTNDDPYGRRLAVKHYEARGADDGKIEADACLKDLLLARMTKPLG